MMLQVKESLFKVQKAWELQQNFMQNLPAYNHEWTFGSDLPAVMRDDHLGAVGSSKRNAAAIDDAETETLREYEDEIDSDLDETSSILSFDSSVWSLTSSMVSGMDDSDAELFFNLEYELMVLDATLDKTSRYLEDLDEEAEEGLREDLFGYDYSV